MKQTHERSLSKLLLGILILMFGCKQVSVVNDESKWVQYHTSTDSFSVSYSLPPDGIFTRLPKASLTEAELAVREIESVKYNGASLYSIDYMKRRGEWNPPELELQAAIINYDEIDEEHTFDKHIEKVSEKLFRLVGRNKVQDRVITMGNKKWYETIYYGYLGPDYLTHSLTSHIDNKFYIEIRAQYGPLIQEDNAQLEKEKNTVRKIVGNTLINIL